ncbi:MAG: regulatory signaling modulator protein AmpE [Idiomarina sp.]
MQLIAVLLAFSIERVANLSSSWHLAGYLQRWLRFSKAQDWLEKLHANPLGAVLVVLLPAIVISVVVAILDSGLVTLVVSVLALLLAVACAPARRAYRDYLHAAHRDDTEALNQAATAIQQAAGLPDDHTETGPALAWLHYRHYAAVLIAYVILGIFGALAYASLRTIQNLQARAGAGAEHEPEVVDDDGDDNDDHQLESNGDILHAAPWQKIMFWVDWLPVRITSAGFLLVGHFSNALPVWLASFSKPHQPAQQVFLKVAVAAEDTQPTEADANPLPGKTREPLRLVALMKRNLLLLIVVLALLTLAGWFY